MSLTQKGPVPRQVLTFNVDHKLDAGNYKLTIDYSSDTVSLNYMSIQPFLKRQLQINQPIQTSLRSIYNRLKHEMKPKRLKVKCTQCNGDTETTVQLSYKKPKKKKKQTEMDVDADVLDEHDLDRVRVRVRDQEQDPYLTQSQPQDEDLEIERSEQVQGQSSKHNSKSKTFSKKRRFEDLQTVA